MTGVDEHEQQLVSRVLAAFLREDVVGLRSRGRVVHRSDGHWLGLDGDDTVLVPVTADGFLCEVTAREPLLLSGSGSREVRTLTEIISAIARFADPRDRAGFVRFAEESARSLVARRLHAGTWDQLVTDLRHSYGGRTAGWTGLGAGTAFDALAARHDHPVYPTSRGRRGFDETQLRAYAPEFHPRFTLRWLAVPRTATTIAAAADQAPYWPSPAAMGLAGRAGSHVLLPVHPLTVGAPLEMALRECGLADECVLAESSYLEVIPTLSMRTVAIADDPTEHVKLPLATATLGERNVRSIKPRTLADGARTHRLLLRVLRLEPALATRILLADESAYLHAEHDMLAVLRRRYPSGLGDAVVVPMAALLADAAEGGRVIDHLAGEFFHGSPTALFDSWITLLFDWQTTLFGYGIALESHQQNISVVLDHHRGVTRLRLLLKDNDTPRVNTARLAARLGATPPVFDDPRIAVGDDRALTDLFTTITVHLCAGSYAFELSRLGYGSRTTLLALVRHRLEQAVVRLTPSDAARLRTDVLEPKTLPIKAMVSAGTLFDKHRHGVVDVNKHYLDGPNYLRWKGSSQ
ncbi:IucA/IucC family protein [Nocardia sp. NPDC052254]|uniref:IucA/IucC family protein n=1 Tax=Nocardia sp. NPDC052254 TaxID=3155681 RepID=UPI003422FF3D